MIDLQRADGRYKFRNRVERDGLVVRGLQIELGQIGRVDAELGLCLEDDLIVVGWHIDGADLTSAIGVIKLVADLVDGDAVDRGLLAIDIDGHLRVLDIEVGGNVEQPGYLCNPVAHFRRNTIKRFSVAALQDVLILALGNPPADAQVLNALEEGLHAGNLGGLLPQASDYGGGAVTLFLRFQRDEQPAVIRGRIRAARTDRAVDVIDRRIRFQHIDQRLLPHLHGLKGGIGRGFRHADQETGIFLGKEALRHDHVEINGAAERRQRHQQHDSLFRQHPVECPFIGAKPGIEYPFKEAKHDVRLPRCIVRFQHPRAQHRRQRQ